jgi:hypothetical protein
MNFNFDYFGKLVIDVEHSNGINNKEYMNVRSILSLPSSVCQYLANFN